MSQQFSSFIKLKIFQSNHAGHDSKNGSRSETSSAPSNENKSESSLSGSPRKNKMVEALDNELNKLTIKTDDIRFEPPQLVRPATFSPESPQFNFDISNTDKDNYSPSTDHTIHEDGEYDINNTKQDETTGALSEGHRNIKNVFHRRHTSDSLTDSDLSTNQKKTHGKFRRIRHKMSLLDINFKLSPKGSSTDVTKLRDDDSNQQISRRGESKLKSMSQVTSNERLLAPKKQVAVQSFNPSKKSMDSTLSRSSGNPTMSSMTKVRSASSNGSSNLLVKHYSNEKTNPLKLRSMKTASTISLDPIQKESIDENLENSKISQVSTNKLKTINRRRSRTLDLSDYVKNRKGRTSKSVEINSNELSDIRSHSLSFSGRSPLILSRTNSQNQLTTSSERNSRDRPRSPYGNLPAPSSSSSATTASIGGGISSRRSSSIVNALSSLVNLKTSSVTSFKQVPFSSNSGQPQVTLDDLPKPPPPEGSESHVDYLIRISPYGKFLGIILVKKDDPFNRRALYHFLDKYFNLKTDPIDVALRKVLMFLELPKEAQEIDRLLTELGKVIFDQQSESYDPCAWVDADQVYFLLYSLLVLHTDQFNTKNKFKMTKQDFVKLIREDTYSNGNKIPAEILSYYFDNITVRESPIFDLLPPVEVFPLEHVQYGVDRAEIAYSPMRILQDRTLNYEGDYQHVSTPPKLTSRPTSSSISSYFSQNSTTLSGSTIMPVTSDIDIYEKIFTNELREVSLEHQVSKIWDYTEKDWHTVTASYTSNHVGFQNRYKKFYSILMDFKGGYIRIHKNILMKLNLPKYELTKGEGIREDDYCYLKIIQMGEIQTFHQNRKIPLVGSKTSIWKSEYGVLTYIGLLVFEKSDWINPQAEKDEHTGVTNYIIDFKPGFSFVSSNVECFHGMFAVREKNAVGRSHFIKLLSPNSAGASSSRYNGSVGNDYLDSAMYGVDIAQSEKDQSDPNDPLADLCKEEMEGTLVFLHSAKRNLIFKCPSVSARDNWVDAINLISAYDGCDYDPACLDNTLVCKKKYSVQERLVKLHSMDVEKSFKLHELETILMFFRQAIPITMKSRSTLISNIKQIATKMDWLLFEIKRSQTFVNIISEVDGSYDNIFGITTNDYHNDDDMSGMIPNINGSFLFTD